MPVRATPGFSKLANARTAFKIDIRREMALPMTQQ